MKNIVIIGGSYAGIHSAHRIFKEAKNSGGFKITLIAPNTHHYWNLASPRAVVPGQLTDEELFRPIAPGFRRYPKGQFEFILATAEGVDFVARKVSIRGSSGEQTIDYDFLILATGSRMSSSLPFKLLGSTEETKNALHELQAGISKAKTIVVAGGGVSGVEIAGELGEAYGQHKEIILITGGSTILENAPPSVLKVSTAALKNLNVQVKTQTRVTKSNKLPNGQQELVFSNGETLTVDVYIPAFGLIPNSSYIDTKFLNARGFVMVDKYLRVKGTNNVWAVGDVADIEPPQYKVTDTQTARLAKNIVLVLANKHPLPYKVGTPLVGFSISKKLGTGWWGTSKLPSFLITWARKDLFIHRFAPMLDGSA